MICTKKGTVYSMKNYQHSEITFPSSDGIHTICADVYAPTDRYPRAIVQLAHGMTDYVGRYEELASYLVSHGFVFAGHQHLGHYKSAACEEDLGFFAERDGVRHLIRDMHTMNKTLRTNYPGIPLIVMGHSMGSFISRLYVEKHPHGVDGFIIHGTGGPNPAVPLGLAVAGAIRLFRGPRARSRFLKSLAFAGYNSRFPKEEGHLAWLTRDTTETAKYKDDPYTTFIFTVSAYADLFRLLRESNAKNWFQNYPKNMPTLIMSGDADPVGGYGKGVGYVYKHLLLAGAGNVQMKLYEGARHELFNELCREDAFRDIAAFVEEIVG